MSWRWQKNCRWCSLVMNRGYQCVLQQLNVTSGRTSFKRSKVRRYACFIVTFQDSWSTTQTVYFPLIANTLETFIKRWSFISEIMSETSQGYQMLYLLLWVMLTAVEVQAALMSLSRLSAATFPPHTHPHTLLRSFSTFFRR